MQEKRKTINGDDLLWAMSTLGFDKYVEPLKVYLSKYREAVRGDKPEKGAREGGSGALVGRPPAMANLAGDGVGVRPVKKSKHHLRRWSGDNWVIIMEEKSRREIGLGRISEETRRREMLFDVLRATSLFPYPIPTILLSLPGLQGVASFFDYLVVPEEHQRAVFRDFRDHV
eukprot:scaffold15698_cov283-Alexandrium_tamarense.AAC.1